MSEPLNPDVAARGSTRAAVASEPLRVAFWVLFALLLALGVSPLWVTDILPLPDYARLLHLAGVMADLGRDANLQQVYAASESMVPGSLLPWLIARLAAPMGVEDAAGVVLTVATLGLPLATLALLMRCGRSRWLVFGVVPWMLGASLFDGDLAHVLGLPLFVLTLLAHVSLLSRPGAVTALWTALGLLLLALADPVLWLVAVAILPLLALGQGWRRDWRLGCLWTLRDALLGLPSIVMLLPWGRAVWRVAAGLAAETAADADAFSRLSNVWAARHLTPLASLDQVFDRMFNRFSPDSGRVAGLAEFFLQRPGEVISGLWLGGIALWVFAAYARGDAVACDAAGFGDHPTASRSAPAQPAGQGALDGSLYLRTAFVLVGLAYLMLPQSVIRPVELSVVSVRLVEPLIILGIASLPLSPLVAPRGLRLAARAGLLLVVCAAVMMSVQTAGTFMLARTGYGSIRSAFGVIPPGRRVLTLAAARTGPWLRAPIFRDLDAWGAILSRGYVRPDFAGMSPAPLTVRPGRRVPAPDIDDDLAFSVRDHGRYHDYVAIHRRMGEGPGKWEQSLKQWHLAWDRGLWRVYRNPTPERWPPLTPDEIERAARLERLSVLALGWVGLARPGERRVGLYAWLAALGVPGPLPLDVQPEPEPAPDRPAGRRPPSLRAIRDEAPTAPAWLPAPSLPVGLPMLPTPSSTWTPPASPLGGAMPTISPDALIPIGPPTDPHRGATDHIRDAPVEVRDR